MINDPEVKKYLEGCRLPQEVQDIKLSEDVLYEVQNTPNPITHVIAIDGGTTEVPVKKSFPYENSHQASQGLRYTTKCCRRLQTKHL